MSKPDTAKLSRMLQGSEGAHSAEELLPLVYDELRSRARAKLARERAGQTLQATSLVHEAYLRVIGIAVQAGAWERMAI